MNDTYRSQFRLPSELADKLREAAEVSGRSLNAEVVARLEASFAPPSGTMSPDLERVIRELESLQTLGALNYRLQRAEYRAAVCREERNIAWSIHQDALRDGDDADKAATRKTFDKASDALEQQMAEIEKLEAQIDDIHLQRQVSGMKELRAVEPVSSSVRSG